MQAHLTPVLLLRSCSRNRRNTSVPLIKCSLTVALSVPFPLLHNFSPQPGPHTPATPPGARGQHMREAAERRQQLELEHEQALAVLNAKQQEIDLLQKVRGPTVSNPEVEAVRWCRGSKIFVSHTGVGQHEPKLRLSHLKTPARSLQSLLCTLPSKPLSPKEMSTLPLCTHFNFAPC